MANQVRQAYQIVENPYYQTLNENPAVELVIENTEVQTTRKSGNHEQQRLASQMPRGTRIDETGTKIQVRGGRNYTSRKLFISREEMFDDVVVRGLRADGLSTKLGVKNHKDGIAKLLTDLFHGDSRQPIVEDHFKTRRQKSNSAKTMFATMTHEELQFLKAETFPSRIDVQVRDYLTNTFMEEPEKLQAAVEVLGQVQQIFKVLTPHTDFLSSHNFQTRGFFLDIVLMTCSFLMQIIQDTDGNPEANPKPVVTKNVNSTMNKNTMENIQEKIVKENKTAAEILLSVGSDILDKSEIQEGNISFVRKHNNLSSPKNEQVITTPSENPSNDSTIAINEDMPTTVVVEGARKASSDSDQWTTIEMVDGQGNSRYMLIKTNDDNVETFSAVKILEMLQNQGVELNDSMEIALLNPNSVKAVKKSDNPAAGGEKVILELESNEDGEGSKLPGKTLIRTRSKILGEPTERVIVEVERTSQGQDTENAVTSRDQISVPSDILDLADTSIVVADKTIGKRKVPPDPSSVSFEIDEASKRMKKD